MNVFQLKLTDFNNIIMDLENEFLKINLKLKLVYYGETFKWSHIESIFPQKVVLLVLIIML